MTDLETMANEIAAATGCPLNVARAAVKIFLRNPAAKAAVLAGVRELRAAEAASSANSMPKTS